MYRKIAERLTQRMQEFLRQTYGVEAARVVVEQPPRIEFGEYALPLAFELAKSLRKAPRKIAEEIIAGIGPIEGIEKLEVAGAGYINVRVDRKAFAALAVGALLAPVPAPGKILVEHSSINPNKAAHIGHLRNAILGDTFVRLLKFAGREVDIQNYIDNTGVQVADVVVGFLHLEKLDYDAIEELTRQPRFDYYCWDVYARASHWYSLDKENLKLRQEALHEIENPASETSAVANLISVAVLRRHLETMQRLDIEYDFLPRESEILHLHFWDAAFEKLKVAGVVRYENEGKNKGCWVMQRPGSAERTPSPSSGSDAASEEKPEDSQKVIVRSNGTVGYVGKDIAYHLWKFGLLGRDFGYKPFYRYPDGRECWISATEGEENHPHFGNVSEIYNVIDARQAEAQTTVIEALKALGYEDQAAHYTHFSYEMVALTPRCAGELGYQISDEDKDRAYIEVSGRKGFGVKADDLLDTLIATAKKEVDERQSELHEHGRLKTATQIAVGALRYFMMKFTKPSVIAFDFKEALSFEGETGPYVQYAVVRAANIFRKGNFRAEAALSEFDSKTAAEFLSDDEIWSLWLAAGKTSYVVEQCIATTEPAYLAKHAFQLAQAFNSFYHKHPILAEADEERKRFLLATAAIAHRELVRVLEIMGIQAPAVM